MQSLTLSCVSLHRVGLCTVLVCGESLILQVHITVSPLKGIFQQNHFSLFIRVGVVGKNAKNIVTRETKLCSALKSLWQGNNDSTHHKWTAAVALAWVSIIGGCADHLLAGTIITLQYSPLADRRCHPGMSQHYWRLRRSSGQWSQRQCRCWADCCTSRWSWSL